uniref:Uncharacterized protein n=1 Tax=Glycine max TaxID=3847 RepID=A0A0R0KXV9_SOYBN
MDPKHQFYTLWDQIIDEELQDNTDEEVVRLMLQNQHEVYNTTQHRQRRKVALNNHDEYFQMRVNTMHRKGLSLLQKCIVDLRILAYGSPIDSVDEYIRIVVVECLQRFVSSICAIFGDEYLRRLNN